MECIEAPARGINHTVLLFCVIHCRQARVSEDGTAGALALAPFLHVQKIKYLGYRRELDGFCSNSSLCFAFLLPLASCGGHDIPPAVYSRLIGTRPRATSVPASFPFHFASNAPCDRATMETDNRAVPRPSTSWSHVVRSPGTDPICTPKTCPSSARRKLSHIEQGLFSCGQTVPLQANSCPPITTFLRKEGGLLVPGVKPGFTGADLLQPADT